MYSLIDAALSRARTMLTLLVMILIAGVVTYNTIPKESSPDITIQLSMSLWGTKEYRLMMRSDFLSGR
ncbi:RND multidrug efflux transporter [Vibrio variabilis]|uniref:RND multidrug efflux transporter n=1 Tax=Vibrio variabilis TaxID=990271 RepID=A0ABQ0J5F7_9VIBR|nr:RND multidrug efflux transporter [Vibrio variabilis]